MWQRHVHNGQRADVVALLSAVPESVRTAVRTDWCVHVVVLKTLQCYEASMWLRFFLLVPVERLLCCVMLQDSTRSD